MAARQEMEASLAQFYETLQCGICFDVMDTPTSTPCRHSFCQLCIRKHIESGGGQRARVRCPSCNQAGLTKRSLRLDTKSQAMLEAVRQLEASAAAEMAQTGGSVAQKSSPVAQSKRRSAPAPIEPPGLFESPIKVEAPLKTRSRSRRKSPGASTLKPPKGRRSSTGIKPKAQPVDRPRSPRWLTSKSAEADIMSYLKSDSDHISEASESFTDEGEEKRRALQGGALLDSSRSGPHTTSKKSLSLVHILKQMEAQAQGRVGHNVTPEELAALLPPASKSGKMAVIPPEVVEPRVVDIPPHPCPPERDVSEPAPPPEHDSLENPLPPRATSRLATKRRSSEDGGPNSRKKTVYPIKSKLLIDELDKVDTMAIDAGGENITKSRAADQEKAGKARGSSAKKPKISFHLKGTVVESRRDPSRAKKPKMVTFVQLGRLCQPSSSSKAFPDFKDIVHQQCLQDHGNLRSKEGMPQVDPVEIGSCKPLDLDPDVQVSRSGSITGPKRTNSFMANIIGDDKDIYSSDEETFSQELKRLKRVRETNSLVKNLTLDNGRLRGKRSRIQPIFSSNESEEVSSQVRSIQEDSPIKDRTNLPRSKRSKMSKVTKPQRSSFENIPSKADFVATQAKASEENMLALVSQSSDVHSQEEPGCHEPPQPSTLHLKPDTMVLTEVLREVSGSAVDDSVNQSDFIGQTEDLLAKPRKIRTPRGLNASAEDTNNSDGSTQAIEERIRKMKEILRPEEKSPTTTTRLEATPDRLDDGEQAESDDDLFECTPQAPSTRLRVSTRRRVTSGTGQSQDLRRKLDFVDLDLHHPNGPSQEPEVPTSQIFTTTITGEREDNKMPAAEIQKMVLITSGLMPEDRDLLRQMIQLSGCVIKPNMDQSITHVVVHHNEDLQAEVTLKFLQAIAMGKFIIGVQWVRDCIDKHKVLDFRPYEVKHSSGEDGPFRSRLSHEMNQTRLFEGFVFVLRGKFQAIPDDKLRELLQSSGARVNRSLLGMANQDGGKRLIIVDRHFPLIESECLKLFRSTGMAVVEKDWIIDCLAQYRILPFLPFMQHGSVNVAELVREGYPKNMLVAE